MMRRLITGCIALVITACSTSGLLQDDHVEDSADIEYSLIYVIHGDSGYLYHDKTGRAIHADKKVLDEAISVGKVNLNAEVFIFHQRPVSHILYLFPRKESNFHYFRGGEKITEESYFSRRLESNLLSEAELYHRYAKDKDEDDSRIFMYYGHEIPDSNGVGYHASEPQAAFNMESLIVGMDHFNNYRNDDSSIFDLTVLSTCSNGSPDVASRLAIQSTYLIASSEVLHLSHMTSQIFQNLEYFNPDDTQTLAQRFVEDAFDNLSKSVQTPIGINLYDTKIVKQAINNNPDSSEYLGITSFYRAAKFGRDHN